MTTHEQNKKTLRHFQCRDSLWEIFERMSAELECSVDYLINEAMRQYARSRNYGTRPPVAAAAGGPPSMGGMPPGRPPLPPAPGTGRPPPLGGPMSSAGGIPSAPRAPGYPPAPAPPPPAAAAYGYGAGGGYGASPYGQPGAARAVPAPPPPQPSSYPPPPAPAMGGGMPMAMGGRPTLSVIFNGQKIPVTKDEFVIGRGSKTSDLPIKDGNISRRHACVLFQGGAFYMKDLGSTNGVEYQGRRLDSKRIEEGDVFHICDYELRFTYR